MVVVARPRSGSFVLAALRALQLDLDLDLDDDFVVLCGGRDAIVPALPGSRTGRLLGPSEDAPFLCRVNGSVAVVDLEFSHSALKVGFYGLRA